MKTGDGETHREFESHTLRQKACKAVALQAFSIHTVVKKFRNLIFLSNNAKNGDKLKQLVTKQEVTHSYNLLYPLNTGNSKDFSIPKK